MKRFSASRRQLLGAAFVSEQLKQTDAHASSTCTMTLAQAPGIVGLKLGMTSEQVLALFPESKDDPEVKASLSRPPNSFGVSNLLIKPERYATAAKFAGVSQIVLTLLDNRVSSFYIGYSGPEWKDVDEFVTRYFDGSNFPKADAWQARVGLDTQLKTLKCREFELSVFAGGEGGNLNYVLMIDEAARRKLKERKGKAVEKKVAETKP